MYPDSCNMNSNCQYIASWVLDTTTDIITFTIVANQTTGTWTAIGFAKEKRMVRTVKMIKVYIVKFGNICIILLKFVNQSTELYLLRENINCCRIVNYSLNNFEDFVIDVF